MRPSSTGEAPTEISPDTWRVPGYIGTRFTVRPPSSNAYVLRDGVDLYIVDPGLDPSTRATILGLVERYRRRGVERVRLLVTQGHFDHTSNAELLRQVDLPWEFLLPDVELPTMHSVEDFRRDLAEMSRYEDVFATMFAGTALDRPLGWLGRRRPRLALALVSRLIEGTMGSGDHFAGAATLLRSADKVERRLAGQVLQGWELGRFFLIHDGAHSPGHICLYDPRDRLVLAGDATVEINPAFLYSSMTGLVDITTALAAMARQGLVEVVADGHRSPESLAAIERTCGIAVLHPTQALDVMRTAEESAEFLTFFAGYYRALVDEVVAAHRRVGRAPVRAVVDELRRSTSPAMRFKVALRFPAFPSRLDVLVAQVARELGTVPIRQADRILLDPPDPGRLNVRAATPA